MLPDGNLLPGFELRCDPDHKIGADFPQNQ